MEQNVVDRDEDVVEDDEDHLELEWRLESIKNRNLKELKHFSSNFEAPSYGYKDKCVESVNARIIELEEDQWRYSNFDGHNQGSEDGELEHIQRYYENQILANPEEELEKEDENYIDNDYPDESDDGEYNQYNGYNKYNEDDGYNYHEYSTYNNNLDMNFFAELQ